MLPQLTRAVPEHVPESRPDKTWELPASHSRYVLASSRSPPAVRAAHSASLHAWSVPPPWSRLRSALDGTGHLELSLDASAAMRWSAPPADTSGPLTSVG